MIDFAIVSEPHAVHSSSVNPPLANSDHGGIRINMNLRCQSAKRSQSRSGSTSWPVLKQPTNMLIGTLS